MIVTISGPRGSGKTTIGQIIQKSLKEYGYIVELEDSLPKNRRFDYTVIKPGLKVKIKVD